MKLVFISYGRRENGAADRANVYASHAADVNGVFLRITPNGLRMVELATSFHEFEPLLFKN